VTRKKAREEIGMPHSVRNGWLWLAGSAVAVVLVAGLPARASAQTVSICVIRGLVKGINVSACTGTLVTMVVTGPTGSAGPPGPTGAQGPPGVQGVAGATGVAGPSGAQGDPGNGGTQGPVGPTGATGPSGSQGDSGLAGTPGSPGPEGPSGPTGAEGPQGEQGPANLFAGAAGPNGLTGATGATGATGVTGWTGVTGAVGPTGREGRNTEDAVLLTGGTLGHRLGAHYGIQLFGGSEGEVFAPGNGAQQVGLEPAQTWIPVPNNPNNSLIDGLGHNGLEDFHIYISDRPGNGGTFIFTVKDLTNGTSQVVCEIHDTDPAPPQDGGPPGVEPTRQSCVADPTTGTDEFLDTVMPGDAIALVGTVDESDPSALPSNAVDMKFSVNFVHDDEL